MPKKKSTTEPPRDSTRTPNAKARTKSLRAQRRAKADLRKLAR